MAPSERFYGGPMRREDEKLSALVIVGDSRNMVELPDDSVHLVVTSPPYYNIKDYENEHQIGFGQSLHEYFYDLYRVWHECHRVLAPGCRLCVNVGDQFARAIEFGRYKVIPLHSEIIAQAENIGFDFLGSIIWQKKTTMNTTGGASVMGSFPFPPNGIVEIDYEFILIFKKLGKRGRVPAELKERARLTKDEWKEYFSGHWYFGGARQIGHQAMFPEELPKRLIRMFTFPGDTVLDPFAGSGTTLRVALALGRNAIGYEVNEAFLPTIRSKVRPVTGLFASYEERERDSHPEPVRVPDNYRPMIKEIRPEADKRMLRWKDERLHRVKDVLPPGQLQLDTGLVVQFHGVMILPERLEQVRKYLLRYLKGKEIYFRPEGATDTEDAAVVSAYVYLKNGIFVNKKLLEMGLAMPSPEPHRLSSKFREVWENGRVEGMGAELSNESLGAEQKE